MKVTFYKSALCPRCGLVALTLKALRREHPSLEVESVDVVTQFARVRRDGVRGFPTLRVGDEWLTGMVLTPNQVRAFIKRQLNGCEK
jgi:hypothetical protein